MVSNKKRVTKKVFNQIMETGFCVYDTFFTVRYLNKEEDNPRCAVVVPKSVSKKASERNKFKRKGYAVLRNQVFKKVDFIVFYKKRATPLSFKETKENIIFLLGKAKIIE